MGEGDGNRARKLLLGKWPPGRGPVPEPELLGTIVPFLSGDVLERACRYSGYALWTRAYERPVGSELFRAVGAVANKRVRKGGLEHYLDTLPDAVRSRPQPLARPTWIAAATLARIAAPWLSEHALSDLQRLGLIAWLDDDELFEVALKSGIEERAALLASLLAPRDVSDAVVSAAASAAHDLPAQNRAVLLAWSCNAARGERRREIAEMTLAAVRDEYSTADTHDAALLASVGLTAPDELRPVLANEFAGVLRNVPDEARDIGLVAEWLERALPEPSPERLRWLLMQRELSLLLVQLGERSRDALFDEYLSDLLERWGEAAPSSTRTSSRPRPRPEALGTPRGPTLIGAIRDVASRVLLRVRKSTGEVEARDSLEPPDDEPTRTARYLNLAVTDRRRRVLGKSRTLASNREYLVRIDIGEHDAASIVQNDIPFPTERLEPFSPEGFWLEVVLVSRELHVTPAIHRFFLPFSGPSWVCECAGPWHICTKRERRRYLYVAIKTGDPHPDATLRCTVYHQNNVIQSATLRLIVADGQKQRDAQRAVVDYTLAPEFTTIERLRRRRINVLTNEAPGGTHRILLKDDNRAIAVDLTESAVGEVLEAVRGQLKKISLGTGNDSQYDETNSKPAGAFIADLKKLALLGSFFWSSVVPRHDDRVYLLERLRQRTTIQVSRVSKVVFPWAVVYDIPRELQATWELCPLLADWDGMRDELASYPDACPYQSAHRLNVLCPYGFWGFKHVIEQPASVRQGVLKTAISAAENAPLVLARSLELDEELSKHHLAELRTCLGDRFEISDCDSRDSFRAALADPTLPLIYFYCHGKWGVLGDTALRVPYLEIGHTDRIGPSDFAAWSLEEHWDSGHWAEVSPLVFINGCQTVELSPEDIVNFVEALAGMNVAGVVGTEISVSQRVAGEVGERFYRQLAGPTTETVGTALHRTRIDLLRKGNVTGLIYTPFCSMDLALNGGR